MPGDATRFEADMPVTLCPPEVQPTSDNAEIGYVTAVSGNTLTITRAQEGSTAMQVSTGWKVLGSITAKTITDIETALDGKASSGHTHAQSDVTGLTAALSGKEATITSGTTGQYWRGDKSWQTLDKTAVGLGNADNTSDATKPISAATQTALDGKASTAHTHLLAAGATDVTSSAAELNILDGATLSTTELNYVDGVTSAIQTQLDGKVDENSSITGATKTKITYDAKGLVTAGADATTADIADSTNKRYVTDAQLTVIGNTSGTNTGDQTSIVGITGTLAQFNTAITDGNIIPEAGGTFTGDISVPDEAYDATAWDGSLEVPTKNAVRDKIEALSVGSGTPGGSDAQIQFNDGGAFGGDDQFVWNKTGNRLRIGAGDLGGNYKKLVVTDRSFPVTDAGADGMLVDIDGGGGIYMTGDGGAIRGKYEAYGGELGVGSTSNHPLRLYTSNSYRISIGTDGAVTAYKGMTINDDGEDFDTRIEGDTDANLLLVDASTDRVGIGNGSPAVKLDVTGEIRASTAGTNSASVVTNAGTQTLTNKRLTPRIGTTASSSTPTPDADSHDQYNVTALAAGATFGAPTGTPTDGQQLVIRVKDNGAARSLAFNSIYRFSSDLAAPTTTVISKTIYMKFVYNAADSKWDNLAWLSNF